MVPDAWALLAWIGGEEPAAAAVNRFLVGGQAGRTRIAVSIVNLGEVYYRIAKTISLEPAKRIRGELLRAPLEVVPASDEMVWSAADLKAEFPISYADAFAAALAMHLGAPLVTGDPDFDPLIESGRLRVKKLARGR